MGRRTNTIVIVPHSKAKFFKFNFSTRAMVISAVLLVGALVLSVVAIAFSGSAMERRLQLRELRAENSELRGVNSELEKTIVNVQARLEDFEERTARLALAAGLEPDQTLFLGGESRSGSIGSGGPYDRARVAPAEMSHRGEWIDGVLGELEQHIDQQRERLVSTPSVAPVSGIITDGFGLRKDPFTGRRAWHRGLDISARIGIDVVAPADGVVASCGRNRGYGKIVRISHGYGFTTVYGHLHKILVEPGQRVERGDVIGQVGNTGRSTGPHLHYEVRQDGKAVNPLYYILDWN